jgi:hypothetical protein
MGRFLRDATVKEHWISPKGVITCQTSKVKKVKARKKSRAVKAVARRKDNNLPPSERLDAGIVPSLFVESENRI